MADFFTEVKAIVLSTSSKAEKIHKLVNDMKCARNEAERFYTIIQCVEGKPERSQTKRQRKFTIGVEIECFGLDKQQVARKLRDKGIESRETGYCHDDSNSIYKLGYDGSICGQDPCEVVSPILRNLNTLKTVCEIINQCGAQVNRSCGLHIHFGASKFTIAEWYRILVNYANIEPVIDSFMAQSRRGNNNEYCRSVVDAMNYLQSLTIMHFEQLRGALNYNRYHKVNLESFGRHKTIEFRQHQGTTDYQKIEKWVNFLGALINYSIDHTEPVCANNIDELPFLTDTQKRYFNNRKQSLNR